MFFKTFVLSVILVLALADSDLEKIFKDTKIIPDVLQTVPKEKLKIEYENGLIAGDGLEYTPTQTKNAPTLDWPSSDPNTFYTLYMASPDAPDEKNPIWSEFLHWLVVNIPGNDVDKGEVYCEYLGPAPPKMGGFLRYAFLIYQQPGKLQFDEPLVNNTSLMGHPNFKIEKFVEKYNLGLPIAGNTFKCQWDEYAPVVHKTMGIVV